MKFTLFYLLFGILVFCLFVNSSYSKSNPVASNGWKLGHYKKYFKDNGYFPGVKNPHPSELKKAIKKLKVLYKFDSSTEMDRIYEFIEKPRCGVPDLKDSHGRPRERRYTIYTPWQHTSFTYTFENYHSKSGLSKTDQERIIADAFKLWQEALPALSFTMKPFSSTVDIMIKFGTGTHGGCNFPFDGTGLKIAHAYFPENGQIHFDDDENFTDKKIEGINLYATAIHEIGHALGLDHSFKTTSVMHPVYQGYNPNIKLDPDDVAAITALYGPNTSPDKECVDEDHTLCLSYKSEGFCTEMEDVMLEVCPVTCNLCT